MGKTHGGEFVEETNAGNSERTERGASRRPNGKYPIWTHALA
jgi:hypothetical protein